MILTTPRLTLRPMRADDVDPLLALFGDPRFMEAFDAPVFDRSRMQAWVGSNLEHQDRFGYGLFTIIERDNGDVIGDCGIETMEIDGRAESELGYDVRRDRWGRGLATEAAGAVARYAFADLGLTRLISLVRDGNRRSARVAEKVGMEAEGRMRRGGVEYVVYAMESPRRRKEPVDAA